MPIQIVDILIKWGSLLSRGHSVYGEFLLSWEESKYTLDDHYRSHSGSIYIAINEIDIIPDGSLISVTKDIYISTNDYSLYSLDTMNSL